MRFGDHDRLLPAQRILDDARDEPAADQQGGRRDIQEDRRPEREALRVLHLFFGPRPFMSFRRLRESGAQI